MKRRIVAGVIRSEARNFFQPFHITQCTIIHNSVSCFCINGIAYIITNGWSVCLCTKLIGHIYITFYKDVYGPRILSAFPRLFSNRINGDVEANYTSISNVNNNKIIKRGSGVLVFDGKNSYQGVTSVENGVLVVSNDQGLGSSAVNANVEVNGGTLRLSSSDYSQNAIGNIYNGGAQIANRNLILLGGDGFVPTLGTAGINLGIPQGALDGMTGLSSVPNQWNGTVTLVANSSAVQTPGAPNPNGDASIGQQFGIA